jgi:hypothetical protein
VCVKLRSKSSVQAVRYKVLVIWQADRIKVLNDGTDELAMSRVVPPSKVAFLEEKILVAKAFNQRIEDGMNPSLDASRVPRRFLHGGSGGHNISSLRLEAS